MRLAGYRYVGRDSLVAQIFLSFEGADIKSEMKAQTSMTFAFVLRTIYNDI